ncbi:MAG TPA: ABC transporter ATP-binding protein [Vicinamibacteria bacterium]|nr:ABC transporter ATP-binding protein [Vicinamibacteria bacterium]
MLEARNLVKTYRTDGRNVPVLRGVDLRVAEGEMVAVVGASGVGKSTLMHVLGTLDVPDEGKVLLEGNDLFALDEEERTRLRNETIGFIFQFHHLLPEFTALENVAMPLRIARASREEAAARAREVLAALGLRDRSFHRPAQLSGGEQQRVAVARALVNDPRLVLADEPTGNLDTATSRDLVALLRSLHERRGLTSIVVTHSNVVASVCDRVLRMEDGRVDEAESP